MRGIETLMREGRYPAGCSAACGHADPQGPWPHETKLEEDAGQVHTDDCIDVCVARGDDDFQHCTSGRPDSKCRVRIADGGGRSLMRAKVKPDVSELLEFPKGWVGPDLDCDRPGREFNAGGIYLLVHANREHGTAWIASVFFGGDVEEVWTKDGFKSAAEARRACVNQGLRLLRECRDALQRADGR